MKSFRVAILFLSLVALVAPIIAIEEKDYLALAGVAANASRLTTASDLRVMAQSAEQLALLRRSNVVLITICRGKERTRFFVEPGRSVKETLDIAMQKGGLTKEARAENSFRISGYPTADIAVYADTAIFRNRPYPKSVRPEDRDKLAVMMQHTLQAGDVLMLDLFGVD